MNEEIIKGQLKELVHGSVEETLNELLEKEAESLTQAVRYERSEARQGYRSGHYDRNLTTSDDVPLHMPRLKVVSFETTIIERYRRRESSVEEALIERWANVTEQAISEKREIPQKFGETLSWPYLCYVRAHPVVWRVPTHILYGERNHPISLEAISAFAKKTGTALTVMPGGEHWFHTEAQMHFLDTWLSESCGEHEALRPGRIVPAHWFHFISVPSILQAYETVPDVKRLYFLFR